MKVSGTAEASLKVQNTIAMSSSVLQKTQIPRKGKTIAVRHQKTDPQGIDQFR